METEHSRLVEDGMEVEDRIEDEKYEEDAGMELKLEDGMQEEKNRRGNKKRWSKRKGRYGGEG